MSSISGEGISDPNEGNRGDTTPELTKQEPPQTIYHLWNTANEQAAGPEPLKSLETAKLISSKQDEMTAGEQYLEVLRYAFQNHDAAALKWAAIKIQRAVDDRPNKADDYYGVADGSQYEACLNMPGTQALELWVAGGTHGERIFIGKPRDGHYAVWMSVDRNYGVRERANFARLFGITKEDRNALEAEAPSTIKVVI